jgi:hypothetical protein
MLRDRSGQGTLRRITTPALRPVTSVTWRELIKRVWEVDPLLFPKCGAGMLKLAASKAL